MVPPMVRAWQIVQDADVMPSYNMMILRQMSRYGTLVNDATTASACESFYFFFRTDCLVPWNNARSSRVAIYGHVRGYIMSCLVFFIVTVCIFHVVIRMTTGCNTNNVEDHAIHMYV